MPPYTKRKFSEKEIEKQISFTTASKKKKTTPQGINLNKEVKLQNIDENYKILMEKKLKERK